MKYKYRYTGNTDVHLPLHGILAKGGDDKAIYETTTPIDHPDFVKTSESEVKRVAEQKKEDKK